MARIVFTPFNQEGEPVKRGQTSMRAKATRSEVAEKVIYCATRDGIGRIVHVEVAEQNGSLHSAWDVRAGCIVQTDGPGSEDFETARIPAETGIPAWSPNQETTDMANDSNNSAMKDGGAKGDAAAAKADKKPAKAAAAPKAPKGPTKKDRVMEMLKPGATLEKISKELGVSTAAARALIGDCQRVEGVYVNRDKDSGIWQIGPKPKPVEKAAAATKPAAAKTGDAATKPAAKTA